MNANMHGGKTFVGHTQKGRGRRGNLWKGPAWSTALILLIPLWGNHYVDGWNWHPGGFVLVGAFLFGTGLTYKWATRNADTLAYRAAVGIALATTLVLVWMNAVWMSDAVEVVGRENPVNSLFFGVPIIGIIGAAIARFRPGGMARTLSAMAFAQTLVTGIVLVIWLPQITTWLPGVVRMFGSNVAFAMLFVGSALLFRKAARFRDTRPRPVPLPERDQERPDAHQTATGQTGAKPLFPEP